MSTTPALLRLAAILSTVAFAWHAVQAGETAEAQVTYVTASSLYVSAGREEGLDVGRTLTVRRGGEVVATIEVSELSAHRAACRIVERVLEPAVGDVVSFEPVATPEPVVTPDAAAAVPAPEPLPSRQPSRGTGIHGRVGVRYLSVLDRTDEIGDYSQPALDLRLDAGSVAGSPWGFSVDARARRTQRDSSDGLDEDDTRTRVYRAAAWWRDVAAPWSFTVGRQYAPALGAISIFDGVSARYGRERYEIGMIAGTQPDAAEYGYSTDVTEYGGYVEFRHAEGAKQRWSLTTGLIASYEGSEVNREFLYVQGRLLGPRWTAWLTQEVDYNRSWKKERGEETISPTSTFAAVSYRAGSRVTLRAGFDNRRNVRLYRDRETPETEFDDTFRRGLRAGVGVRAGRHLHFGLDGWTSSRDEAGDAHSYTATGGARRIAGGHLDLSGRATRYENDRVEGWLGSADVGVPFGRRVYLRAEGGVREEDDLVGLGEGEDQSWLGLDLDLELGARIYLTTSVERTSGDRDEVDLLYTTMTYRF